MQSYKIGSKFSVYTISSYDIQVYKGGFYGNGVLYIPLPHHAGTSVRKVDYYE